MATEMSEEEIYRLTRKRAELARRKFERRGFYLHFAIYSVVNIVLAIIWRATGSSFPWFAFPLGIWGIFLLFHFLWVVVFSGRGRRGSDWVKMMTEKEVERLKEMGITLEEIEKLKEVDRLNGDGK